METITLIEAILFIIGFGVGVFIGCFVALVVCPTLWHMMRYIGKVILQRARFRFSEIKIGDYWMGWVCEADIDGWWNTPNKDIK